MTRRLTVHLWAFFALTLAAIAQPAGEIQGDFAAEPDFPGDVLSPTIRSNTPNIKLHLILGINRAQYSNDRFLDNRPLDVGTVFGETDVYAAAGGFGYQFGLGLELPQNSVFSWVLRARYDRANFSSAGVVEEPCLNQDGDTVGSSASHEFLARIDYIKLSGAAQLTFPSFFLNAGLAVSTPFNTFVNFDRSNNGTICYYPDPDDIRNRVGGGPIPDARTVHFALRFGGGLLYEVSDAITFAPELTLDFGMSALNKSPESDLGIYALSGVLRIDL